MFLTSARKFIEYEESLLFGHSGGKATRFRPGQSLHPAGDIFLRQKVQPAVQKYLSPCEDEAIRFFDFINNVFLTTIAQLFQWLGTWNLLSYAAWPYEDTKIRDGIYFACGLFFISVSLKYWNVDDTYEELLSLWQNGFPSKFGWGRKLRSYFRKIFSFVGYLFVWVGAWDFIDAQIIDETVERDILFVLIPLVLCFVLEEVLSPESVYYLSALRRYRKSLNSSILNSYDMKDECCIGYEMCQVGRPLYPSQDYFLQYYVQPAVKNYITPLEDWLITIFNWLNSILFVTIAQLFLWVGMSDTFSYYVWPYDDTAKRDLAFTCLGFLIMTLSYLFFSMDKSYSDMEDSWHNGLPIHFGLKRKFKNYAREMLNFLGFLFVWVGAWDFLDTKLWDDSVLRDCLYIAIPLVFSFILEEILAADSIYYMAVQLKKKLHADEDEPEPTDSVIAPGP